MIKTLNSSKHSGLLCLFTRNKENKVLLVQCLIKKFHFLHNLWIGPIFYSVKLRQACQGTEILAYFVHTRVTKKIKCCKYGPRRLFRVSSSCEILERRIRWQTLFFWQNRRKNLPENSLKNGEKKKMSFVLIFFAYNFFHVYASFAPLGFNRVTDKRVTELNYWTGKEYYTFCTVKVAWKWLTMAPEAHGAQVLPDQDFGPKNMIHPP
jgi:hypothetical protein